MHIIIKNKKLLFNHYKIKCAVGKRGISKKKIEGDFKTPKGSFKILNIFYRKDRVFHLKTNIPKSPIYKNMGWCDDPDSKKYNKLIKFPFSYRAEKLYRSDNIYDIILVLNYNMKPTIKDKGSAIFIHVAKKKYNSTKGCVAIAKRELKKIIKSITNKTKVKIF
tara:strand:- start:210 stop:701 length:492 start_codon:yes stop_codon:yes gene_type:complete